MSPPRRRSSRLRTPAKAHQEAAPRLTALAEHDETPTPTEEKQPDIPTMATLQAQTPQTPATGGRIKPPREEMHPSMTHRSTTQKPDSGLRHGFKDIEAKGGDQPSGVQQQTPSKIGISSPTFDFKFARPAPMLGPEAQRMMDELREEALRIKAKLAAEREEQRKADAGGSSHIGGRKIAQAKGKATRYSEVHMAEFKKMDSIANHPSAFRAQPGRITPATSSLKRTQSRAQLGDREDSQGSSRGTSTESDRLENSAPAKRARQRVTDDTSSARPASRGNTTTAAAGPSTPRSKSASVLASLTTPTQASLARTTSVKHPATQIPTLSKSSSKPNLKSTPRGLTKAATMNNIAGSMTAPSKVTLRTPSKFDRIKSILRHPSFSTKKASKPSTIPSLTTSESQSNLEKALPSVPTTPIGVGRVKSVKRVEFTPDTRDGHATSVPPSPSPVKSAIPRSTSKSSLKATSAFPPRKPASSHGQAGAQDKGESSGAVEYPSLAGVRPLPEPPLQTAPTFPPPSVPGTFTFRSDHTISFGKSPEGFGSSPHQATVRQVRRSIFPGSMPGSFPDSNKENVEAAPKGFKKAVVEQADIPTVPHGMSNKKRRRIESDEEEDRSPKKQKSQVPEGEMLMAPRLHAQNDAAIPKSPSKKRGLTLSRLNMLARPKNRK
ncbi:erythromycin esterase protein [Rutstroemia sp. NJR-2017a WRK4]|nr:erythromycin esterase protein [Rutstroemia sp. NJR-2017a WRK4]PQE33123.1 erythromycin esterase protein [Rutstroemia sp. NJR-2017a WRK4]